MTEDEINKILDIAIAARDANTEFLFIAPEKLIYLILRMKKLESGLKDLLDS